MRSTSNGSRVDSSRLRGLVEFVRRCKQQGLKVAVASSADAVKVEGNLHEIGLPPEMFDAIVNGSELVRKKPAPACFAHYKQPEE